MLNPVAGWNARALMDPPSRAVRLAWALWMAIIALSIVCLLTLSPAAHAAPIYKATGTNGKPTSLTLLDTQCSNADVLKALVLGVRPNFIEKFKDARLHWDGKDWASCWMEYGGVVYSIDEEGSPLQPIPRELFRDDSV